MPSRRSLQGAGRQSRPPARLADRIGPNLRVLFVGINPGIRSAAVGHHFAGPSNRFWKLLYESGLVPEPVTWSDDDRLLEWRFGITNLVARATPGIGDLEAGELLAGRRALVAKVRRHRPAIVALVGVTIYRALFPEFARGAGARLGEAPAMLGGARVFVLPNPSGRNANYSYAEMLDAFRRLGEAVRGDLFGSASENEGAIKVDPSHREVTEIRETVPIASRAKNLRT